MSQQKYDKSSISDSGWNPPPPEDYEEYEYESTLGDEGDTLRFRQCWDLGGRLVDFAVILLTTHGGRMVRVAEADVRHGELHIHFLNRQGMRIDRQHVEPILTQEDVEKAYDAALDLFSEKWEEYKRRWRDG